MPAPETYDDLLDEMYGNRMAVIEALHFFNGEANTRNLREHGDIPRGSMYNLLTRLEEWDVIEQTGQEPIGRGGQADVFQFTELGRTLREDVGADDRVTIDEVKELSAQVEANHEAIEEYGERIDALRKDLEELGVFVGKVEQYFKDQ